MPAEPAKFPAFEEWTRRLACPACLEALRPEAGRMVCAGCGRAYPVVDGIPVLIVERAEREGRIL
ncbi:MAG: Trm112 family protein [Acidobacteriota bacterium]|nr:Trm112 family protein [Acidobacteriota bacterium]